MPAFKNYRHDFLVVNYLNTDYNYFIYFVNQFNIYVNYTEMEIL